MAHNIQEAITKLNNGEIKFRDLESIYGADIAAEIRRTFVCSDIDLPGFDKFSFVPDSLKNKNIENLIGGVSIPLGIAGPIEINGNNSGKYYLPMATTEGTLVASTSRGIKACNLSGGVNVVSMYNGMTRAPVFWTGGLIKSKEVVEWVNSNMSLLQEEASKTNKYITLLAIKEYFLGENLWLRMSFDTDEAMGMNMATIGSRAVVDKILAEVKGTRLIALSGNMCADKKSAMVNSLEGRGYDVDADVFISEDVINKVLKTSAKDIEDVNRVKVWQGSTLAGSLSGYNAHFANIVSSVFVATGQDIAHIVDASNGYTNMVARDGGLYVSIKMPAVPAGTVGGGTRLTDQAKAMELMLKNQTGNQIYNGKKTSRFVEILAAAVLAAELSLHAALAAGHLSQAHQKFGQGKSI